MASKNNFKENELIIYQNGDRFEIGRIKRLTEDGAFVYYHSGDTASKTPFDCMHKLQNSYCITQTNLGGATQWTPCSSLVYPSMEVMVCREDGTIDFDIFDFAKDDWKYNSNNHKNKVIAWMKLPEPYTDEHGSLT